MNTENEHDYFRCIVQGETPRAFLVMLEKNGESYWAPKSLCELRDSDHVIEIEAWFAQKEGWHDV